MIILNRKGVKRLFWYVVSGILLWYFFLRSGIHPTVAGVLMALTIPAKPDLDSKVLKQRMDDRLRKLEKTNLAQEDPLHDDQQRKILRAIKRDTRRSRPPLLRLENRLSSFNAYFIIPVFAFANAGVLLDIPVGEVFQSKLGLGIILGLVLGKALGITFFAFLSDKIGLSKLPVNMKWRDVFGMGFIAGIGFTMSLFITNLAFETDELIKVSKISILLASIIAGTIGSFLLLRK
jgi:NhaA family Na+:H+ antiporter